MAEEHEIAAALVHVVSYMFERVCQKIGALEMAICTYWKNLGHTECVCEHKDEKHKCAYAKHDKNEKHKVNNHVAELGRMFPRGYVLAYVEPDGEVGYSMWLKDKIPVEMMMILRSLMAEPKEKENG